MIIYYAHCVALYGTPQEKRDIAVLDHLFPTATLINPGAPGIKARVDRMKDCWRWVADSRQPGALLTNAQQFRPEEIAVARAYDDDGTMVMHEIFQNLAETCDLLVFRALPDGSIPAGVAKEIAWAQEARVIVMELPSCIARRSLTTSLTREYLTEVGQR
jgi:hypothetical protein